MSIPLHQLHADLYAERRVPPPGRVVDGVWAVPVPLRGSPLRSITVYLLESSRGLVLVDAGYQHPDCWRAFTRSVDDLGLRLADIELVLLTHNHPDHVGFADQVREASGAPVAMHRADDFAAQRAARGGFLEQLRRALDDSGAPADVVERMHREALGVARHAEDLRLDLVLDAETTLEVGDLAVRVVPTPGHTYGHTVYAAHGVVLTGDTMMAEGPTQLAIAGPDDDPLGDLLASLDRIARLEADGEVDAACPAHQYAYRGVAERAAELAAHHGGELEVVRGVLERDPGARAWDVAPHLTWSRPWDELGWGTRRFALMHTLALTRAARAGAPRTA